MKHYFNGLDIIYLHPGEIVYSKTPVIVSTLLGSCISITMYCPINKFSAISHNLLPACRKCKEHTPTCKEPYKYVECTIIKMMEEFDKMKIRMEDIEIKVFGGADVLETLSLYKKNTVGNQNINSVISIFNKFNLKIMASDVGGIKGRKILFNTGTGEVFLNRMKNNE